MLLQDITIVCRRNIFKILKGAKTYEAEAAKYVVKAFLLRVFVLEYFHKGG